MYDAERLKALEHLVMELLRRSPDIEAITAAAEQPISFTSLRPNSDKAIEARRFHDTVRQLKLNYLRDAKGEGRTVSDDELHQCELLD